MIVNTPTSENMVQLALRLYFGAWAALIRIECDFDMVFPADGPDWTDERKEYLEFCQPELQAICTVIQQSNELALKARICEVSPYLLLLNSNPSLSTKQQDIDFTTLRTLDAVDLPAAVNSLCPNRISDKFIQTYNQIRSYRNQIAHLGETTKKFQRNELLHLLIGQYLELWPDRMWLKDRVEFASQTRTAFFHDGRYGSAHAEVFEELEHTFDVLTGAEFKALFGQKKTTRRYRCHSCWYEGTTKWSIPDNESCKTAFLEPDGILLRCLMCGEVSSVTRTECTDVDCKGNVIAAQGEYAGSCHSCGHSQDK